MMKKTILFATVALAIAGQAEAFETRRGNTYSVIPKDHNFKMEDALLHVVRAVPNYTDGYGARSRASKKVVCGYTSRQINAEDYRGLFRRLFNPRSRAVYERSYECQTVYTPETAKKVLKEVMVSYKNA
jgi:hypothetical protein